MIILMSVEKTYIDDDEDGDDKDDDTVPHLVSAAVHLSTDGAALLLAVTCLFNASWQILVTYHFLFTPVSAVKTTYGVISFTHKILIRMSSKFPDKKVKK